MFFGPQNISFNDQDMIYHNNTQLSLKSGDLTKFTLPDTDSPLSGDINKKGFFDVKLREIYKCSEV